MLIYYSNTYSTNEGSNSGYQSFFHPQNKFKGIGVVTEELSNSGPAYPVIVFTPISNLSQIITNLEL